jgi:hypothetical protein
MINDVIEFILPRQRNEFYSSRRSFGNMTEIKV